jgi:hypothetical protein
MKIDGVPVEDAAKPVKLHITKADVNKGNNKDPGGCAAAQACMRELGAEAARVHIGRTYLKLGKKWVRFHTPPALRSEIIAFDRGGTFEPGEYYLAPMQPTKKAGKRQGSKAGDRRATRKAPAKARAKHHTVTGIRAHGANR